MGPSEQTERDKRHIRSLQNPRLIADFRLCNVPIAQMERGELLGVICWLIRDSETFKKAPKRKQQPDRTNAHPVSASA